MARIRSSLINRFTFLAVSAVLLVLSLSLVWSEKTQEWKTYQQQYHNRYQNHLRQQITSAEQAGETAALNKWQRLYHDISAPDIRIRQIFLPDAGVRDLCGTCHMGMENPMFASAPQPLGSHPPDLLRRHPPNRFGCTLCHQGQGTALTARKAHGLENNWLTPRLPLRYTQALCLGCHESALGLPGAEKAAAGERLFVERGCYGCHATPDAGALPSMAAALDNVANKIQSDTWLYGWVLKPAAARPHTRMPAFRLDDSAARDIVAYLKTLAEKPLPDAQLSGTAGDIKTGRALFVEKGCIACHSVEHTQPSVDDRVPNLADAGLKLADAWIPAWLKDPFALIPGTPMPRLMLTDSDIRHLTAYVAGLKAGAVAAHLAALPPLKAGDGDALKGRRQVQSFGCYGCHPIRAMQDTPNVGLEVSQVAHKRLEELPFGNAEKVPRTKWDWLFWKIKQPEIFETRDMPLKMPDYDQGSKFTPADMEALTVFYLHNAPFDLPSRYRYKDSRKQRTERAGDLLLSHYHCAGCHQLTEAQTPRIASRLSLKSMVPPRLVGEGARVQPQWLFQFLSRPVEMRPWLSIRMPEFSWDREDRNSIIDTFAIQALATQKDALSMPYVQLPLRADYDPETIEMGEYRIVTDKCMQCHPVSTDASLPPDVKLEDLSINLMLAKSRLRFDWIKNFLRNPDRYAGKDTKMPFVYYTPDRVPRMPDPEMWIEYAARYLMFMESVPEMPKEEKVEDVRPGSDTDWTSY